MTEYVPKVDPENLLSALKKFNEDCEDGLETDGTYSVFMALKDKCSVEEIKAVDLRITVLASALENGYGAAWQMDGEEAGTTWMSEALARAAARATLPTVKTLGELAFDQIELRQMALEEEGTAGSG